MVRTIERLQYDNAALQIAVEDLKQSTTDPGKHEDFEWLDTQVCPLLVPAIRAHKSLVIFHLSTDHGPRAWIKYDKRAHIWYDTEITGSIPERDKGTRTMPKEPEIQRRH